MNITSGAAALAVAAVMGYAAIGGHDKALQAEPLTSPRAATYRLVLAGQDGACSLSRGAAIAANASALVLAEDCGRILPMLANAHAWHDADDGSVAFRTADGGTLLRFSFADGAAYESFEPAFPIVSLMAVE